MAELILIMISFVIIIYIIFTSKNNTNQKKFEEVLNENYKLDDKILVFELKKRDFIDNMLREFTEHKKICSIVKEQDKNKQDINNEKITIFKNMLENGYDEIEICKSLNIGRGEFLLLKSLYKAQG